MPPDSRLMRGTFAVGWPSTTSGDAESVLTPLGGWIDDYNGQAPHSALGMRTPAEYRASLKLMATPAHLSSSDTPSR